MCQNPLGQLQGRSSQDHQGQGWPSGKKARMLLPARCQPSLAPQGLAVGGLVTKDVHVQTPMSGALFGNGVFADVISEDEVILD